MFDDPQSVWRIAGNSEGYRSPVFVNGPEGNVHCFVKVGDELRHSRYLGGGRWEDFASVGGGRLRSNPVVIADHSDQVIEVYGVGLENQLARNVWSFANSSWGGWQNLGSPDGGILGTPAVKRFNQERFVCAKGLDNRLYLLHSEDGGESWGPSWERDDTLRSGQLTGDVSTFIMAEPDRSPELVLAGRSMEGEIAFISRAIGTSNGGAGDSPWSGWGVVANSRGYSSSVFAGHDERAKPVHCFIKVGNELRHGIFRGGSWEGFAPVGGGRLRSDPVAYSGINNGLVEVYGEGLDGQLARNVWREDSASWTGWQDLGRPGPGISGTPAILILEWWEDIRYVFVKGNDNRVYLSFSAGEGQEWAPWEQSDKLGQGRIRGDVSAFLSGFGPDFGLDHVLVGRSMENELASISENIF